MPRHNKGTFCAVLCGLVLINTFTAELQAQQETPADYTMWQHRELELKFVTDTFVEEFRRRHDPKEDGYADAIDCVEHAARWMVGFRGEGASDSAVRRRGTRALNAGLDDPLLSYARSSVEMTGQAEKWLGLSLPGLVGSDYPLHWQALGCLRQAHLLTDGDELREGARELFEQGAALLVKAVDSGAWPPQYERLQAAVLHRQIEHEMPLDLAVQLCDELAQCKSITPWVVELSLGTLEVKAAWKNRGAGAASSVTEEGWAGFHHHLQRAYEHYTRAHAMAPDRPEAATELIKVAMGGVSGPGESERVWFDRAVAAQVDWMPAYERYAFSLRPRWGGSYEEMLSFGVECVDTARFDTAVPDFLIVMLVYIADDDDATSFWSTEGVYEAVARLANGYQGRQSFDSRKSDSYWHGTAASIAHAAERFEDALEHLKSTKGGHIPSAVVRRLKIDRGEVIYDAYLYTGDVGERLINALAALRGGDLQAGLAEYEQALAATPTVWNPTKYPSVKDFEAGRADLHAYLLNEVVAIRRFVDLMKGGWVDLDFDEKLSGWTEVHGSWTRVDDRTVVADSEKSGLLLTLDTPVGPRWALRGTYRFPEITQNQKQHSAAVYIGLREGFEEHDWQAVAFRPEFDELRVQRRNFSSQRIARKIPIEPVGEFLVEVWDGAAVVVLDGKVVFEDDIPRSRSFYPGYELGIGGLFWYQFKGLQFTNLSLRLLAEPPAHLADQEVQ